MRRRCGVAMTSGRSGTGLARRQFVRFLVVGLASYAVDVGTLWLLVAVAGLPLVLGTTLAFAASFVVNFGGGRRWVFRSDAPAGPQLVRYFGLVGLNYLLTIALMLGFTSAGLGLLLAKTLTVGINAVLNFVISRAWVYR